MDFWSETDCLKIWYCKNWFSCLFLQKNDYNFDHQNSQFKFCFSRSHKALRIRTNKMWSKTFRDLWKMQSFCWFLWNIQKLLNIIVIRFFKMSFQRNNVVENFATVQTAYFILFTGLLQMNFYEMFAQITWTSERFFALFTRKRLFTCVDVNMIF